MQLDYIDTEAAVCSKGFSGQFEQDSFVHSSKVSHIQKSRYPSGVMQFAASLLRNQANIDVTKA